MTDLKTGSHHLQTIVLLAAVLLAPAVAGDVTPGPAPGSGAIPDKGTALIAPAPDEAGTAQRGAGAALELQTIEGDFSKTGREIMDEVYRRHQQYPYVYEEQTMIMVDRDGLRDTRKLLRYSRMEQDGGVDFMLLFVSPLEVKGVALLAHRDPAGSIRKSVYLPAFGARLIEGEEEGSESSFLGSDFAVENLTGEVLENYFYVRRQDEIIGDVNYLVVDAYLSKDDARDKKTLHRHFIRRDNYFITETDHYDRHARLYKKQTSHDLKHLEGDMWRANMMLMDNLRDQHKTLIKIDQRIYSRDYVPSEMFTAQWLFENYPDRAPLDSAPEEQAGSGRADSEAAPESVHAAAGEGTGETLNP